MASPSKQTGPVTDAHIENAIRVFEDAVYAARCGDAAIALEKLMVAMEHRQLTICDDQLFGTPAQSAETAQRICSAMNALLLSPRFDMSHAYYEIFCSFTRVRWALYALAPGNTAQQTRAQIERSTAGTPQSRLRKLYALTFLPDIDQAKFDEIAALPPEMLRPWLFGQLACRVVLDKASHEAREALLSLGDRLGDAPLAPRQLMAAACSWMMCSYAERPDKHLIKGYLNGLIRKGLRQPKLKSPPPRALPLIAVVAEQFKSNHAMYRCYADAIRQLRGRARLLLVAPSTAVDAHGIALFDDHLAYDTESPVSEQAARIAAHAPDMTLFLSAGMSEWGIPLANLRLAPVQILTPGHPATSVSDAIDYLLCPEDFAQFPELYSERLLVPRSNLPAQMYAPPGTVMPAPQIRERPDTIRIAVNSTAIKLSRPFLVACAALQTCCERPIEWHFMPAAVSWERAHLVPYLAAMLKNVYLYPTTDYNDYLTKLNECDLALGTFPFGGSNSNIDLIRLGIPKVWMTGREFHGRADRQMLGEFGISALCEAETMEDYVLMAKRLVEDDALRVLLSRHLIEHPLSGTMLAAETEAKSSLTDFADTLLWAWQHHEAIVAADVRVVRVGEPIEVPQLECA